MPDPAQPQCRTMQGSARLRLGRSGRSRQPRAQPASSIQADAGAEVPVLITWPLPGELAGEPSGRQAGVSRANRGVLGQAQSGSALATCPVSRDVWKVWETAEAAATQAHCIPFPWKPSLETVAVGFENALEMLDAAIARLRIGLGLCGQG
ncbi:hypothetical protein PMAC_002848 [Pneumocystis sp. 'macacae']|nr:hypothetical protein PMAC_002848 [Pneumocystis sp. 'macacae']